MEIFLLIKVGLSPSKKVGLNGRPLKTMKMFEVSCENLFSFSRYLNFCFFFGHVGKQLDKEPEVKLKINYGTDWETSN